MRTPGCASGTFEIKPRASSSGIEAIHLGGPKEQVDLGERGLELSLVALHQTSDGHDGLATPLALDAPSLNDRVDGLLLGRVNKPTGVDDDHVGVERIGGEFGSAIGELREVSFGIDRVLVAA